MGQRTSCCREGGSTTATIPKPPRATPDASPLADLQLDSKLIQLPLDLILEIFDHLRPESRACLHLTCKAMYALSQPFLSDTSPSNDFRDDFLPLLEKDLEQTYYCHSCKKLRRFEREWGSRHCRNGSESRRPEPHWAECYRPNMDWRPSCKSRFNLRYQYAHLAVNLHLYGPNHGLPLGGLHLEERNELRKWKSSESSERVVWSHSWLPRIIDNDLYLRQTHRISQPTGNVAALQKALFEDPLFICHQNLLTYRVPDLQRLRDFGQSRVASAASCVMCLTDWDLLIEWEGEDHGWVITLVSYHCFGSCRSPSDWMWASMVHRSWEFEAKAISKRDDVLGAQGDGIVRARWWRADAEGNNDLDR